MSIKRSLIRVITTAITIFSRKKRWRLSGTFTHNKNLHKCPSKIARPTIPLYRWYNDKSMAENWLSLLRCWCRGFGRFARYCGKMNSRHLFSCRGLIIHETSICSLHVHVGDQWNQLNKFSLERVSSSRNEVKILG